MGVEEGEGGGGGVGVFVGGSAGVEWWAFWGLLGNDSGIWVGIVQELL